MWVVLIEANKVSCQADFGSEALISIADDIQILL